MLERLEKAEPRNALALFYLGAAAFAQGDKPAAARRWKTLLALLPSDAPDPRDARGQDQGSGIGTAAIGRRRAAAAVERSDEGARARTVQK